MHRGVLSKPSLQILGLFFYTVWSSTIMFVLSYVVFQKIFPYHLNLTHFSNSGKTAEQLELQNWHCDDYLRIITSRA